MLFKFVLPMCLLAVCASATSNVNFEPILAQQQLAMRLLMHTMSANVASGDMNRDNGVDPNECFSWYLGQQDTVAKEYNQKYTGCMNVADNAKGTLSSQTSEQRAAIVKQGNNVCSKLSACEVETDGLAFFQCYYEASSQSYPEMYDMSVQSNSIATNMQIQYQKIDNDLKTCTTEAHNVYVTDMATSNSDLSNCLIGQFVPPGVTTTTVAGETTTTPVAGETTTTPVAGDTTTTPVAGETTTTPVAGETTTAPAETTTAPAETTTTPAAVETTTTPAAAETTTTIAPDNEAPEEDIFRFRPMSRMNMWNVLRQV